MKKFCVVVPVHSAHPSDEELLALAQCQKIFFEHDIFLLYPKGLDVAAYKIFGSSIICLAIDPFWQSSIINYNKLKCSEFFYSLFSKYEYLLTYELDAYVFKDELEYWYTKGYDYIGAPWFEGWNQPCKPLVFKGVGNSGFSLRNIHSCLLILKRIRQLKRLACYYYKFRLDAFVSFNRFIKLTKVNIIFNIKSFQYLNWLISEKYTNEDGFWGIWVANTFKSFKVAPVKDAIKFSFEVEPSELYKVNNNQLPFGCHAWGKYEPEFWRKFINFKSID